MRLIPSAPLVALALLASHTEAFAAAKPFGEPVGDALPLGDLKGDPVANLPAGMRLISSFGERPAFSPDGRKIAFVGQSYGDAFEYEIATGRIRNLTAHMAHKGFLRVQYLPDGSYVLLGPHEPGATREETRNRRIELWWMDKEASRPAVRLNVTVWEGVATSAHSNRIAWAEIPARAGEGRAFVQTRMMMGEVVVENGRARIANAQQVLSPEAQPDCMVEAQDFLPGDRGLTFPCYNFKGKAGEGAAKVMSVDFATGRTTTYPTPPQLYGEVEGIFPDGRRTLVECSGDRTRGMDLCVLELKPDKPSYTRITRVMDYGQWKMGNPVVSPDGRMIAAQIGSANVIDAGVGQGVVVIDVPPGF